MITNERQYHVTKAQLKRFEEALRERQQSIPPTDVHPRMWQAEQDALKSQLAEFREELRAYEDLKAGRVEEASVTSLDDLPRILIQARIALGLTQKQLAERLNVKEQQVQHDEATLYASASLHRLKHVAEALGVRLEGCVRLLVEK